MTHHHKATVWQQCVNVAYSAVVIFTSGGDTLTKPVTQVAASSISVRVRAVYFHITMRQPTSRPNQSTEPSRAEQRQNEDLNVINLMERGSSFIYFTRSLLEMGRLFSELTRNPL